ncbi:glycine cleavage system protein GcvH [Amphritea sp. 2_MG-2023]|jgi:glycine cleavage system H protein|uniref:glycine cleavage system protein GcvH n=1 Tax=Amphritea TaxID=515417 RepID=UPI001C074D14|nr:MULTISPECIES: glycine cleavage system protein GcvH [Amphritea]MBU2965916.1 glycine cleavage system protein GcvH [Amphritea atlantica]MDO6418006.1 glycine cleavage system protein GcvH [Amphritea sp. 2_MG-2023]MDX2424585.1 glycine cleavage system protein GcvH [Amphritea sp.]
MNIPTNYRFASSHEWVLDNGDGTVTMGISDHAQDLLGDVVFVELPEVGREVAAGEEFSLVESVKAASDIYAPIAGEVIAINETLEDEPELVNSEPYEGGWIVKIKLADAAEVDALLDADAYAATIAEES